MDSFRSSVVGGDCSGDLEALGFAAAYIKWENPGYYPKKRCIYIFSRIRAGILQFLIG